MGRKCAVPHCYTGYRKCKEKASLYRVPDDDFFLSKWQEAIAREDRPITPKDYVCEKHFKDDDILRRRIIKDVVEEYQRPRLKPDAIPSIFPDLPEFILKMVKKRRKMTVENPKKETDSSLNSSNETNKTETETTEGTITEEVKKEPLDATELETRPSENRSEAILNNEIEIKTEPEEIADCTVENDGDNEKDDPTFGPKMHRCNQCEYQTKYPHNLRTHMTKHLTGEDAYIRCEHCPNYKTKWELTYRNHLKIKHGIGKQEVFKCTLCQFETKVKLCLKRHYKRHTGEVFEKKFSCTFPGCEFKDESKALLDLHISSHNTTDVAESSSEKTKAFKCTECLYETNSKTHILRHIKSAHNSGDDTIVSVSTKKQAKSAPLLSELQGSGLKEKSMYKCLRCSYKSHSQANLLKHVFKHKYPKPTIQKELKAKIWKCSKCPYATFFQHALKRHAESECGKDVYFCTDCNFKSSSKPDYIKHTLTHRNISVEAINQNEVICGEAERLYVEPDIQEKGTLDILQKEPSMKQIQAIHGDSLGKVQEVGRNDNERVENTDMLENFVMVKVEETREDNL